MSQVPPPVPPSFQPPMADQGTIPYATPAVYQQQAMQPLGVWSQGDLLVCTKNIILPAHCCIKCDQPADGQPLRKKFSWHNPWLFLTILAGVLIYLIIALAISEKAQVQIPLCRRHRQKRTMAITIALLTFLAGIACFFVAAAMNSGWPVVFGFVLLIVAAVVGIAGSQVISPKKIDSMYAWFKGASPSYLAGLPGIYPQ